MLALDNFDRDVLEQCLADALPEAELWKVRSRRKVNEPVRLKPLAWVCESEAGTDRPFAVVYPMPGGENAIVPIGNKGFEVERATYATLRPAANGNASQEPNFVSPSMVNDSRRPLDRDTKTWLRQTLDSQKARHQEIAPNA